MGFEEALTKVVSADPNDMDTPLLAPGTPA
jgi:hypothetical protein